MLEELPLLRGEVDALHERVLIFDGAMGTSLQKMNLSADHFRPWMRYGVLPSRHLWLRRRVLQCCQVRVSDQMTVKD